MNIRRALHALIFDLSLGKEIILKESAMLGSKMERRDRQLPRAE